MIDLMQNKDDILVNYGGFVAASTVDWRGEIAAVLFLRGCPLKCWYCHNKHIRDGSDLVNIEKIYKKIDDAIFATSFVISGGEPTLQPIELRKLAFYAKSKGLKVGLHTCGMYPNVIIDLIKLNYLDKIALDIKTTCRNYETFTGVDFADNFVGGSLIICAEAYRKGKLPEFEVVTTVFENNIDDVYEIVTYFDNDIPYVLQQGIVSGVRQLSVKELVNIGLSLNRDVKVRTRETGELVLRNGELYIGKNIKTTLDEIIKK